MFRKGIFLAAVVTFGVLTWLPTLAEAQLHREMRQLFEGMLDELSPSVQKKFKKAIEKNSASIEFTKEEFLRFRRNPVNPFDGLDDIDPSAIRKSIVLKFELPSLRSRRPGAFERQNAANLFAFQELADSVRDSVVKVLDGNEERVLGTIVDGGILTKASELEKVEDLRIEFRGGAVLAVKIKKLDPRNDVALLVPKAGSSMIRRFGKSVKFSNSIPKPGAFVFTTNERGKVFAMGSLSNPPRNTLKGKRAFLGVQPKAVAQGIFVESITADTSAAAAGLKNGDIIVRMDGVPMREVGDLVNHIRKHEPGDSVRIEYLRDNQLANTTAQLAALNVSGRQAAQFKMMSRLGAIPSKRSDGFPMVMQHDIPIYPEQCGGPVLDIKGNVIGINIARQGRAASYAIPATHVKTLLEELSREEVAKTASRK